MYSNSITQDGLTTYRILNVEVKHRHDKT